jgi:hypothetical protein
MAIAFEVMRVETINFFIGFRAWRSTRFGRGGQSSVSSQIALQHYSRREMLLTCAGRGGPRTIQTFGGNHFCGWIG